MAFDNTITLVGNATADPELRFTQAGVPVASFSIAVNKKFTPRGSHEPIERTSFVRVNCWRTLAENVGESITKGMRVIVYGEIEQRSWETDDGDKRSTIELVASAVGPDLTWATASVTKNSKAATGSTGDAPPPVDPFGTDEEPF